MNTNKSNHGWILCPSKSFPGKFYYFNVVSGETAWSLNDAETKTLKQDVSIQKLADKSHSYPEPLLPPLDFTNSSGAKVCQITRKVSNTYVPNMFQSQTFGQAVFPKYFSNSGVSNIVWAPMPMIVAPEMKKPTADQVTQTCDLEREILVQSCAQPLCKRFSNYEQPIIIFNEKNQIIDKNMFNKFCDTSTPKKELENVYGNSNNKSRYDSIDGIQSLKNLPQIKTESSELKSFKNFVSNFQKNNDNIKVFGNFEIGKPNSSKTNFASTLFQKNSNVILECSKNNIIKEPIFKLNSDMQFPKVNCTVKPTLSLAQKLDISTNPFIDKQVMPSKSQPNTPILDSQKSTLQVGNKVENPKSNPEQEDLELKSDDLRFLLVAKRRKSVDEPTLGMKATANMNEKSKKKVTFQLNDDYSDDGTEILGDNAPYKETKDDNPSIEYLKSVQASGNKDCWYVVVDAQLLLDNFELIEGFVKRDDKCKLLVPHAVLWEIGATCMGDCGGRRNVIVARQLARMLASPPQHVVVQSTPSEEIHSIFLAENIIDCALEAMNTHKHHVILITNDSILQSKATSRGLPTYTLQELKDNMKPKHQVTFALKNLKVIIHNDVKQNLFLQNSSEFSSYLSKNEVEVAAESFKNVLFDNPKEMEKHELKDSTISPIPFDDKLINITRPKRYSEIRPNEKELNYDSDTTSTFEIGHVIQKLKLNNDPIQKTSNMLNGDKSKYKFHNDITLNDYVNKQDLTTLKKTFHVQTDKATIFQNQTDQMSKIQNGGAFQIQNDGGMPIQNGRNAKYSVTDRSMETRLISRMDEWICSLTQIMEDALSDLLQNSARNLSSPWYMNELIELVKSTYNQPTIRTITNKLSLLLFRCTNEVTWKLNLKPNDFMEILGLSACLIRSLKAITPTNEALLDAENALEMLLQSIKQEAIDCDMDVRTPVISRSDLVEVTQERRNFVKSTSDIVKYLSDHFVAWKGVDERTLSTNKDENRNEETRKIVRTFGKNLSHIKIDNCKTISFEDNKNLNPNDVINKAENALHGLNVQENTCEINKIEGPKVIRNFQNIDITSLKNTKRNETKTLDFNLNFVEHGNTFDQDTTAGPKVIRNLTRIEAFEDKLKKKPHNYDLDELDYEIDRSISAISNDNGSLRSIINEKVTLNNDSAYIDEKISLNDKTSLNNDISETFTEDDCDVTESSPISSLSLLNDKVSLNNESLTNDSGFESVQACSLVKKFLSELSFSFKMVYTFINESVTEIRNELHEDKKKVLRDKTKEVHFHLVKIITKLNSIIERESNSSSTAKELLIKSGEYDYNDKRLTRYRQVVTKCLEQAQMLLSGVDVMRAVACDDYESLSSIHIDNTPYIKFFNIFE